MQTRYLARVPDWPSLRRPELRRLLMRQPLKYRLVKSAGSHGLWMWIGGILR